MKTRDSHKRTFHGGEGTVSCEICGKVKSAARLLKCHMISHRVGVLCNQCGKSFETEESCRSHARNSSHGGEISKILLQPVWKIKATRNILKNHMMWHTNSFQCPNYGIIRKRSRSLAAFSLSETLSPPARNLYDLTTLKTFHCFRWDEMVWERLAGTGVPTTQQIVERPTPFLTFRYGNAKCWRKIKTFCNELEAVP